MEIGLGLDSELRYDEKPKKRCEAGRKARKAKWDAIFLKREKYMRVVCLQSLLAFVQ